jgi:hypothetical protein
MPKTFGRKSSLDCRAAEETELGDKQSLNKVGKVFQKEDVSALITKSLVLAARKFLLL